ncbi:uncharacterized protein LOC121865931 [Homarus americanus]|uniref:uncharacterized protein LOC121865931 n=1 Tax=Homarus americanus TaxID=6706 RepID=UPI001C481751|nr:uncharacterized protein LOC121865931 [Homarus americanus]
MENENGESWRRVLRLPVVVAMLSPLLLLADLALIAVFILQQNWHAVILLSVVLFCGAQAIYWYFRTKSILTTRQQLLAGVGRGGDGGEETPDDPPTYDEVLKTEAPPPPYYMAVNETAKPSSSHSPVKPKREPSSSPPPPPYKEIGVDAVNTITQDQRHPFAFTSPFINQITNDEGNTGAEVGIATVAPDPVGTMRTPIVREISPVHLRPEARIPACHGGYLRRTASLARHRLTVTMYSLNQDITVPAYSY